MKSNLPRYWIMDGRAHHNVDDATILDLASTLKEARKALKLQGHGVIYDSETNSIIYP